MDAVKVSNLFKGVQFDEMEYFMDTQSPHIDTDNWEHRGHYYAKAEGRLDILHKFTTDTARDVFEVHDLLPTSARIQWYEFSPKGKEHYDEGPVEYSILYNYYSEYPVKFQTSTGTFELDNLEAIAYCGSELLHQRLGSEGISICLAFNYARPSNPHFALGEYNGLGYRYNSTEEEVKVNWL